MTKPLHKFVVDRARWVTADTNNPDTNPSMLRNPDGNMCCVGFLCKSMGLDDGNITGASYVEDLTDERQHYLQSRIGVTDDQLRTIYDVNDDTCLDPIEREDALKLGFAKLNIKISFTGRAPNVL